MTEKTLLDSLIDILKSNPKVEERYEAEIESFKRQLEEAKVDRCRLGVIGVTSSGKSTMINAIMKKELLTMAVRPSSSQLVTCSKSSHEQVTVYFEDKPKKVITGKSMTELIKKFSDEKYNPKNEQHVKQLELSTPGFSFPEDILLIDSPGLDAYGFEGHEKLTMNSLLPTIDFCIYVTTTKSNSDGKMRSVLDSIADYNCPLIIVQNMIDAVEGSVDGKKSKKQIADEHLARVRKTINQSKIENKNSVRIVQISSKWALKSCVDENLSPADRANLYRQSNFERLIDTVVSAYKEVQPQIENGRLKKIKSQINEIISNAEADLKSTGNERKNLKFEYKGYDKIIDALYDKTISDLNKAIKDFCKQKDIYLRLPIYQDCEIKKIKEEANKTQDIIISVQKKFRNDEQKLCEKFGLSSRRLRVLDSFGRAPELSIKTKSVPKKVKKSGFFAAIGRILGNIFNNTEWGYTNSGTEKIYDHNKTKESIESFFDCWILLFNLNCNKFEDTAKKQINILHEAYTNSLEAFENRKTKLLDEEKALDVIKKLRKLSTEVPDTLAMRKISNIKNNDIGLITDYSEINVAPCVLSLIDLAKKTNLNIHHSVFNNFTCLNRDEEVYVIGWDKECVSSFIYRSFSNTKNINVYIKPKKADFIIKKLQSPKVVFIVFNATQEGAGLNEIYRSEILSFISKNDTVYFIAQDLEEIINGDGLEECIHNMRSLGKKLSIEARHFIMVNHSNPVYNMVLCELQMHKSITLHSEEISLIHDIQEQFPYLRTAETDKNIHKIISGYKTGVQ